MKRIRFFLDLRLATSHRRKQFVHGKEVCADDRNMSSHIPCQIPAGAGKLFVNHEHGTNKQSRTTASKTLKLNSVLWLGLESYTQIWLVCLFVCGGGCTVWRLLCKTDTSKESCVTLHTIFMLVNWMVPENVTRHSVISAGNCWNWQRPGLCSQTISVFSSGISTGQTWCSLGTMGSEKNILIVNY